MHQEVVKRGMVLLPALESIQSTPPAGGNQASGGTASGGAGYVEGYDPNANYYTNDYSWE
jgi:hypothetical protein